MWKRWLALLLAGMLVLCMTGCRRTGGGEPSDQKINVYTSKDYETKDFVAQLGNVDYVGLVEEILANTERWTPFRTVHRTILYRFCRPRGSKEPSPGGSGLIPAAS